MPKETRIGSHASVKVDLTGLNNIMAGIQEKYVVKVGILGGKAQEEHGRKDAGGIAKGGGHKVGKTASSKTNAEIGLAHEVGVKSRNLPRRSWLQNPLEDKLPEYFKKIGSKTIANILVKQIGRAYQELGLVCEQIILKGFETGGYGKWQALKQSTIARKGSSTILVDTAQLKKSITSQVVTK